MAIFRPFNDVIVIKWPENGQKLDRFLPGKLPQFARKKIRKNTSQPAFYKRKKTFINKNSATVTKVHTPFIEKRIKK